MSLKRQYAIRVVYLSNILIAVGIIHLFSKNSWFGTKEIALVYAPSSHTDLSGSPSPVSLTQDWADCDWFLGWYLDLDQGAPGHWDKLLCGIILDSNFTLYVSLSWVTECTPLVTDILWTLDPKLAQWAWLLVANIHRNVVYLLHFWKLWLCCVISIDGLEEMWRLKIVRCWLMTSRFILILQTT